MLGGYHTRGIGVLEVLISSAIVAVVVTALFTFVVRSFTPPREQYEQGRITEEARTELNRVSDLIRNSTDVDFNFNGRIDGTAKQEQWLQYGDNNEIIFYANRDAGGTNRLEEIRLWLADTNLNMEVRTLGAGACFTPSETVVLARGIQNLANGAPVFSYYFFTDVQMSVPVFNLRSVERVRLDLIIDTDLQQKPDAARIQTEIKPRRGLYTLTVSGGGACNDCIDNDLDGRVDTGQVLNTLVDPGCGFPEDTSEKGDLECDDGFDNDLDDTIDFQKYGGGDTTCTTPLGTTEGLPFDAECDDGGDNDNDTLVDLNDPGCASGQDNFEGDGTSECQDGADNDGNNQTDFPADPGCISPQDLNEAGNGVFQCNNGFDDDGDTFEDLADSGCTSATDDSEAVGVAECDDTLDNDGNNQFDWPADFGCVNAADNDESNVFCNDGLDNDSDGKIDWGADTGCSSFDDATESGTTMCNNGLDDDGDGAIDITAQGQDPQCHHSNWDSEAPDSAPICGDNQDNDGDGLVDYPADPGCSAQADGSEANL